MCYPVRCELVKAVSEMLRRTLVPFFRNHRVVDKYWRNLRIIKKFQWRSPALQPRYRLMDLSDDRLAGIVKKVKTLESLININSKLLLNLFFLLAEKWQKIAEKSILPNSAAENALKVPKINIPTNHTYKPYSRFSDLCISNCSFCQLRQSL